MSLECEASPSSAHGPNEWIQAYPREGRAERAWYPPCKAVIEFLAALFLLVATAPVHLLAALLVKLTSSGPAFYWQTRLGRGGREFTIYKIRSMYDQCESVSGVRWSGKGDPRVTPLGRVLRLTHIDELPQLWNVLKGDMSLIGPRPERPEVVEERQLDLLIPRYRERLQIRPGVTGFAQVQLPADFDLEGVRRKLAYDLYYVEAMNPWMDLCIVLSTALKMVGVPFHVLRRLFSMPSAAEVEGTYQNVVSAGERALQVQPT